MILETLKSELQAELAKLDSATGADADAEVKAAVATIKSDALALVDKAEPEIEKLFEDAKAEAEKIGEQAKADALAAGHSIGAHLEGLKAGLVSLFDRIKEKL